MFGVRNAAQAREMLEKAQAAVVKVAQAGDLRELNSAANQVAFWDGYAALLAEVEQYGAQADEFGVEGLQKQFGLMQHVAEVLARGADDEWSGRSNEARRARFDGVREAAKVAIKAVQLDAESAVLG
ncbi:hypothetical protein ACFV6Y_39110 [Streptomyces massasporeus]|uniref:hypothetical protein n=1 Tax=Streptomyces massasporeus TaxID=67324 RepID=UPI0036512DE1